MRIITLLGLLLVLPVNAQTLSESGKAELDEYLQSAMTDTHIPGLVALVTNSDGVIYQNAFGYMDVAGGKPMTPDAIFRIASMTKPVTSLAVMMLVEKGQVGLDDPIEKYLPDLADREVFTSYDFETGEYQSLPAKNTLTVRHLLTHTSGLGYTFDSPVLAHALEGNFGASATSLPLLHEPGDQWTYGESTRVLGHLVEAVSGMGLFEFMVENIVGPLEMADTSYAIPEEKNARVVTIHRSNGAGLVEDPNPAGVISSPENGDGGLSSTAEDYSHFIRLFLNDGVSDEGARLVGADIIRSMGENHTGDVKVELMPTTNPLLSEPFPLGAGVDTFGLGFQVTGQQIENSRAPGSMAWAGIFNTEFWIDPETGIGGVLLMQYLPFYDADAIEVLQGFEQRIYENLQ